MYEAGRFTSFGTKMFIYSLKCFLDAKKYVKMPKCLKFYTQKYDLRTVLKLSET